MLKLFGRFSSIIVFSALLLNAQSFENFKRTQSKSFSSYKDEKDNTFNRYLKEHWESYNVYKGTPLYENPKPVSIPQARLQQIKSVGPKVSIDIKKVLHVEPKPFQKFIIVKEKDVVKDVVSPVEDKEEVVVVKEIQNIPTDISFDFYGSRLGFNISDGLKDAKYFPQNQEGIANYFNNAASSEYIELIREIKKVSDAMNLNDWGVYLLVLDITNQIHSNEDNVNLLSWFIFNKLGYVVKIGLADRHIVLMHYSDKIIYSTPSYKFSDKKYYVVSRYNQDGVGRIYSYKQDYPDATKPLNLAIKTLPNFSSNMQTKTLSFKEYGKTYEFPFEYNQNLINFMATYPQADYETFFNAPVDSRTYESIADDIKRYVDGMKTGDAMNFVLHFVQKAFVYERDNQQFGREKVMFATETLYFDKSDCEDRAVLYSYLIKELFGIAIVGVKYSDHMSTALYAPMSGDMVKLGKRELIVADPTYIDANIGQSMPKYKSILPDSFVLLSK